MFSVFGKTGNGYGEMQFFHNLSYGFHLPFSTVGNDQVGKSALFVYGALITSSDHFFHGCIVVRSFYRFDNVFPVVLFGWFNLFEYYAGGYGIRSLNVGVVETFYLKGWSV